MSDRDIRSWDQRLIDQVDRKWENYWRKRIDLSTARNGEIWTFPGEFIAVEKVSSESALATIAFGCSANDRLDLKAGTEARTVFTTFFLWNTVQAGEWLDVIIGINFEYYQRQGGGNGPGSEAQPAIIITNALPNTNTVGAAHVCNRVLIRAHTANGGTAWVNFGAAAVAAACFELTAGDAISVPLSNTNRINVLFTNGGDVVTVIYEV